MKIVTDFRWIYFVVCPHNLLHPYYCGSWWAPIVNTYCGLLIPPSSSINARRHWLMMNPYCGSLIPPSSTINARRHSYFVWTCFLWNKVPLSVLDIDRRAAFRHALYNYLCFIKWTIVFFFFLFYCSAVIYITYVFVVCLA